MASPPRMAESPGLVEWATATPPGESRSVHYGDDTDMYYKTREGSLLRCTPDFSQMDGSVDHDTIRIVIKWILRAYHLAWPDTVGEEKFWAGGGQGSGAPPRA
uniref:RNA-dependent RNA polymerase n=1 Tax=Triatoma infestans TaxID=30076 RepID=A0A170V8I7_TRIIF